MKYFLFALAARKLMRVMEYHLVTFYFDAVSFKLIAE